MPRRSSPPADSVVALAGAGVVRVEHLVALGLTRSTIAHRCRPGGPWRRLAPGIVKLDNGPVTRADRRRAAVLHAGPGAVITGLDALDLHGMQRMPSPSGPVHVLIPGERRRGGAGLALVERTDSVPTAVPGRWPLAPIARAALDAARRLTGRNEIRALLAEVVQRGRCSPAELNAELADGSGRGTRLPRQVLLEISDGVRSVAEANAREIAKLSGLPTPLWNAELYDRHGRFIAMPDAWFDEVGLAWEIDSREFHTSPADYERTLERRSTMMAEGIVVLHTLPKKLTNRADALDELKRTYAAAAQSPRPAVVAVPQC